MTTQQWNQAKPTRSSMIHHINTTGCEIRHKTNEATTKCEVKHGIDY